MQALHQGKKPGKRKSLKKPPKREIRKVGDIWIHGITGGEYKWDGNFWRFTGRYPYGVNPMGW